MTTREEAEAKIDALEAEASELERLLRILAEPLPTEEQQDLLNDLKRRFLANSVSTN